MSELKACPFCGGKANLTERAGGWTVDCEYSNPIEAAINDDYFCLLGCMSELCVSSEQATMFWNKRPIEDALSAEIERLREALG